MLTVLIILVGLVGALMVWTQIMARQAEAAVPRAGKLHPVNGGAIHYVEIGPLGAPVLVMIHGLSAQLQHFTYGMTDDLRDDFRLLIVDRPGCGYSTRDGAGMARLDEQARMLWQFLDERGIDRPVLVGHSLGGALALNMALAHPDKAGALALIAPLTQAEQEMNPIFKPLVVRVGWLRWLIGHTISAPMGKFTKDKLLEAAFAPEPPVNDFMERAAAILGMRPKGYIGPSEDLVMLETHIPVQAARYDGLKVPGGVLFGAEDPLLSASVHGKPMQAFGLDYEELPKRGHMLPITAPQICAGFVRRMAEKVQ
ncbi:MAG: alpha/beta fold hydrolase [Sedimentitalea sp.]